MPATTPDTPLTIVFLDRATFPDDARLPALAQAHRYVLHERTRPHEVASRIADADVVIVNKVRITADNIAQAHKLKLVALSATGTDNVDVAACQARGIAVCNVRDYARHSVPEHTFALIFALRRSLLAYRDAVGAGRWQQADQFCFHDYPIRDLAGSTLGIVGDGTLGQSVGAIGNALGMQVVYARHGERQRVAEANYLPMDDLLAASDIITLHVPLRPETRHLIDAQAFARMARRPLLINTARGGLVDEHALDIALRSGRIAGAGFDVASVEPPDDDHVLVRLSELPNVIVTPHVAWASNEAIEALLAQLVQNIDAFLAGQPRNLVQG